jgi:hypothetical protein
MRTCQFSGMRRGSTQEPPRRLFDNFNFLVCSAASEPSSAFAPKPCRRHYLDYSELIRRTMSPMYLGYFITTTSPIYLFLMTILAMETIQENFYYS